MQGFHFSILYRPGPKNGNANGLSRQSWKELEEKTKKGWMEPEKERQKESTRTGVVFRA